MNAISQRMRMVDVVKEFFSALKSGYTYDIKRNYYIIFGFLWGIPIPVFFILGDLYLSVLDITFSGIFRVMSLHPIHILFLLHPFIFATVFGALGAIRYKKETMIKWYVDNLEAKVAERTEDLVNISFQTVKTLSETIESKDPYTRGHSDRVCIYATQIAQKLGKFSPGEFDELRYAAYLHDIGKIGIPETILGKKDKLTRQEFSIVMAHSERGERIMKPIIRFGRVSAIIRQHHERCDGSGYPDNLTEPDILLESKIIAVADTFDAMTSDRSYRNAYPFEVAIEELKRCSGQTFDPYLIVRYIGSSTSNRQLDPLLDPLIVNIFIEIIGSNSAYKLNYVK